MVLFCDGDFLLGWRWVDPRCGEHLRQPGRAVLKPVRVGPECRAQGGLAHGAQFGCRAVVHAVRGREAAGAVAVLGVVPGEEGLAMRSGVLDTAESLGKLRAVLHGLELRLRVGVIVADVRSASRRSTAPRRARAATCSAPRKARDRGRIRFGGAIFEASHDPKRDGIIAHKCSLRRHLAMKIDVIDFVGVTLFYILRSLAQTHVTQQIIPCQSGKRPHRDNRWGQHRHGLRHHVHACRLSGTAA